MSDVTTSAFLDLVAGRRGHFRLESGHHAALWLDLDALFAAPSRVEPFIAALAAALAPYRASWICGPLLGGAFLAQLVARELGAEFCFTERVMPAGRQGMYAARYRLPPAFTSRLRGQRVAIVDDVMSAGSALRGTHSELQDHGALPVAAGALLVLGATGADYFAALDIPVEAAARTDHELWRPDDCPLCAALVQIEDIAAPVPLA